MLRQRRRDHAHGLDTLHVTDDDAPRSTFVGHREVFKERPTNQRIVEMPPALEGKSCEEAVIASTQVQVVQLGSVEVGLLWPVNANHGPSVHEGQL